MLSERRLNPCCLVLICALALAACGNSSRTSSSAAPASSAAGSTTRSAPTASAQSTTQGTRTAIQTATSGASGTTTNIATATATRPASGGVGVGSSGSGMAPCRASDLALSFLAQQGGMGHGEIGFVLRNVSSSSCRTYGYPGVLFLDRAGHPLPTIPTHTTHDFFGVSTEVPLVVAPGHSVSFHLGVTHGLASAAGCTTAYGLQVIPPNDTATLRTSIPNGAYECQTATVSPLQAGDSAYPTGT